MTFSVALKDAYMYKMLRLHSIHFFFCLCTSCTFFSTEYLFFICSVSASLPALLYFTLCFLHFQGHRAAE